MPSSLQAFLYIQLVYSFKLDTVCYNIWNLRGGQGNDNLLFPSQIHGGSERYAWIFSKPVLLLHVEVCFTFSIVMFAGS